jgi:hypothetical protein
VIIATALAATLNFWQRIAKILLKAFYHNGPGAPADKVRLEEG